MPGGPSGKVPLPTRQPLLASVLGEKTCHRSRIGNALPRSIAFFAKGLLQLRSGLPHKYYTAVLCAADAQALALGETDFEAKVGAPKRLGDCQDATARQHEVLGGDGPMRTAWRRDLTHGEARARTSVKRPWDCVSHESAVTLDTQSCVIPLVPQAALAATKCTRHADERIQLVRRHVW